MTLSDDDGAADTAALSRAEPVLTETMAELYLRQGHQEDALRVYQALLAQRPHDARLRARVDALVPGGRRRGGEAAGESVPTFLKRILAGRPRPRAPVGPPAAGSPLDSAFAIASVEDEPSSPVAAPGEATRPAEDTISLDRVFGDEGPPATPAAPEPPPVSGAGGGFSFDQFFGAAAGSTGSASDSSGGGPGAPSPMRTSGSRPRPEVEDEGDLDQFQAWLKGLKS